MVTGASDGIGRAFALGLADRGFSLMLVARSEERLQAVARAASAKGVETQVLSVDLSAPAGVDAVLHATLGLDVGLLVAAAGFGTSGPFVEGSLDAELSMIDVNCRAVVQLCHAFSRRFVEKRRGGMVLFSSLVGFQGVPRAACYAATKGFIQTFAEGLHVELRPFGVDVLACAPGPVRSGFGPRAAMTMGFAQTPESVVDSTLSALGRRRTVRPGLLSKLLGGSLMFLPRWGRTQILAQIMASMTQRPGELPASTLRPKAS